MGSFWRVFPFVWPHRRKVLISTVFAFLVALFWGLNLTAAFPVVKVLLEGQGLGEYVDAEIEAAETETPESSALVLASAWSGTILYVNNRGQGDRAGFIGLRNLVFHRGVQSLTTMRRLAGVI